MADELRSAQQQFKDELFLTYKRMTEPEERKKEAIKRRREEFTSDLALDAGL